jgi:hypothetical protein
MPTTRPRAALALLALMLAACGTETAEDLAAETSPTDTRQSPVAAKADADITAAQAVAASQ